MIFLEDQIGDGLFGMIRRSMDALASQSCVAALTEWSMLMREGLCFAVMAGHVFDAEVYGNPVLNQLRQLNPYVCAPRR